MRWRRGKGDIMRKSGEFLHKKGLFRGCCGAKTAFLCCLVGKICYNKIQTCVHRIVMNSKNFRSIRNKRREAQKAREISRCLQGDAGLAFLWLKA